MAELKDETFEAFSRIAKEYKTDSWIRREIHEEIKREINLKDSNKVKKVTMVIADLVNALRNRCHFCFINWLLEDAI